MIGPDILVLFKFMYMYLMNRLIESLPIISARFLQTLLVNVPTEACSYIADINRGNRAGTSIGLVRAVMSRKITGSKIVVDGMMRRCSHYRNVSRNTGRGTLSYGEVT